MMFLFLLSIDEEEEYRTFTAPPSCSDPNSRIDHKGKCACNHGWLGDYPVSSKGCWKCVPSCNTLAVCVHPGKCECKYGLVGDGTSHCDPPFGEIENTSKIIENTMLPFQVNVTFKAPNSFVPFISYCRFNKDQQVIATILSNSTISCEIPINITRKSTLEISFDGVYWSEPENLEIPKGSKWTPPIQEKGKPDEVIKPKWRLNKPRLIRLCVMLPTLSIMIYFDFKKPRRKPVKKSKPKITPDSQYPK